MRTIYDINNEKNLRIMYMIKKDLVWDFRNPIEKGISKVVRFVLPKLIRKSTKIALARSFTPLTAILSVVKHKMDLLATSVKQV